MSGLKTNCVEYEDNYNQHERSNGFQDQSITNEPMFSIDVNRIDSSHFNRQAPFNQLHFFDHFLVFCPDYIVYKVNV